MPYPLRINVVGTGLQLMPMRGARLFRSGLMPERDTPFVPTFESCPVAGLNAVIPSLASTGGAVYSYRTPRFNVRLGRSRQSSCTYVDHAFVRILIGLSAWA